MAEPQASTITIIIVVIIIITIIIVVVAFSQTRTGGPGGLNDRSEAAQIAERRTPECCPGMPGGVRPGRWERGQQPPAVRCFSICLWGGEQPHLSSQLPWAACI